jgi:signal transduction histidine kinase
MMDEHAISEWLDLFLSRKPEEFMPILSSELRTCVTPVVLLSRLLEVELEPGKPVDRERAHFFLKNVRENGEKMLVLLEAALQYDRMKRKG